MLVQVRNANIQGQANVKKTRLPKKEGYYLTLNERDHGSWSCPRPRWGLCEEALIMGEYDKVS